MCFGVCWTKHIGKFSKTSIKSEMQLASPTPSCVVNNFVCPLFPCTHKAIWSPKMEPSSLSLVYTDVNKALFFRALGNMCSPSKDKKCFLFSLPQSILLCLVLHSLPKCCCFPVLDRGVVSGHPRWDWPPVQACRTRKLELIVDCADSYRPLSVP